MTHALAALFCAGALAWGLRALVHAAVCAAWRCDADAYLDLDTETS